MEIRPEKVNFYIESIQELKNVTVMKKVRRQIILGSLEELTWWENA